MSTLLIETIKVLINLKIENKNSLLTHSDTARGGKPENRQTQSQPTWYRESTMRTPYNSVFILFEKGDSVEEGIGAFDDATTHVKEDIHVPGSAVVIDTEEIAFIEYENYIKGVLISV